MYGRTFNYLVLNTGSNILSHKEVRQAISYAINREQIVNEVHGEKYIIADNPLEYGSYLYNKENAKYKYDQNKAKQILQDNGWTYRQGDVWQKKQDYTTLRLRINLLVNSSNETRVKTAEIIKKNLEDIGIQVNVVNAKDWNYENSLKNKNYDILITRSYCSD